MGRSTMSKKCCKEVKSLPPSKKHRKCGSNIGSKMLFVHVLNKYFKAKTLKNYEKY